MVEIMPAEMPWTCNNCHCQKCGQMSEFYRIYVPKGTYHFTGKQIHRGPCIVRECRECGWSFAHVPMDGEK